MNALELQAEKKYIYHERLALLGCFDIPSADQHNLAVSEADAHIAALKAQEKQDSIKCLLDFRDTIA